MEENTLPVVDDNESSESTKNIQSNSSSEECKKSSKDPWTTAGRVIEEHNQQINKIKGDILKITSKPQQLSCKDEVTLKILKDCLAKELALLDDVVKTTIEKDVTLDENDERSSTWDLITLATTLEEDQIPRQVFNVPDNVISSPPHEEVNNDDATKEPPPPPPTEMDLMYRDKIVDCLQKKLQLLQIDLAKICAVTIKNPKKHKPLPCCQHAPPSYSPYKRVQHKICCPVATAEDQLERNEDSTIQMKEKLDAMSGILNQIQLEFSSVQKERLELDKYLDLDGIFPAAAHCTDSNSSTCVDHELEELRYQHKTLLTQYTKKDCEVERLKEQMESLTNGGGPPTEPSSATAGVEIKLLKKHLKDMQDDEEEFRLLISELQEQINDYREKYLLATQKLVEQRTHLDSMEMDNNRIEDEINNQVRRVKTKFEEKLRELAPLPKQLDAAEFRLNIARKEIEDLRNENDVVQSKLKKAQRDMRKKSIADNGGGGDDSSSAELESLRKTYDETVAERTKLRQQVHQLEKELKSIKQDSARQLSKTKERSEGTKENMQIRINQLELELAQLRANSAVTLADREHNIKSLQQELNEMSNGFGDAQRQIKQLKKRIMQLVEPTAVRAVKRMTI